jgi:hypothetical protein
MKNKTYLHLFTILILTFATILILAIPAIVHAQEGPITPPTSPVKLIFIHHSVGENWLQNGYGNLGQDLDSNNYFVSDTNYGWGPSSIGDQTDILDWRKWFRSANTPIYMAALYAENGKHSWYTRSLTNPGGPNQIVMFKSCYPNSNLAGNPNDPPTPGTTLTVGTAKYTYNQILGYFGAHPEKLFIVITAPPELDPTYANNARAFNTWLVEDWLSENSYPHKNVAVWDFYNVLTDPNNHHRYRNGAVEYINHHGTNTLYYDSSGDAHPNTIGSRKATTEFIPMLNYYYNRWKSSVMTAPTLISPNGTIGTSRPIYKWNAVNGATSYRLAVYSITTSKYVTSLNVNAGPHCSGGTCAYKPSTVLSQGDYRFKVRPHNATGWGPLSTWMQFRYGPPAAPSPIRPNGTIGTSTPTYKWRTVGGATVYRLSVYNVDTSTYVINVNVKASTYCSGWTCSFKPTTSLIQGNYRFKVRARNGAGWGPISSWMKFRYGPPAAPLLISPSGSISSTTPSYTWKAVSGAAVYRLSVYYIDTSTSVINVNVTASVYCSGATCSFTPATALSGGNYRFKVRARNAVGWGPVSTWKFFTVAP